MNQKTIKIPVSFIGKGIHTGSESKITLHPAPPDTGIIFRKKIQDRLINIPAKIDYLVSADHSTSLGNAGFKIATVEHLLAFFSAFNIYNVIIDVEGEEIPILDGSSIQFASEIIKAGIKELDKPQRYLKIIRKVEWEDNGKFLSAEPAEHLIILYSINFHHPAIGHQELILSINEDNFLKELAPARTFGFLEEVEKLKKLGLIKGAGLDNAIVLDQSGVVNEPLRFKDEFVRHKIVDLLGDISLLGMPIIARINVFRGGHSSHISLVKKIFLSKDSYELIEP